MPRKGHSAPKPTGPEFLCVCDPHTPRDQVIPSTEGQKRCGARRLPPGSVSVGRRDEIQQGTKGTPGPLTVCHGQRQLLLFPELWLELGWPAEAVEQGSQDPPAPRRLDLPLQEEQPKQLRERGQRWGRGWCLPTATSYTPSKEREPEPGRTRLPESSALWKCCSASVKEIGGGDAPEVLLNPAGRQGVGQSPTEPWLLPE